MWFISNNTNQFKSSLRCSPWRHKIFLWSVCLSIHRKQWNRAPREIIPWRCKAFLWSISVIKKQIKSYFKAPQNKGQWCVGNLPSITNQVWIGRPFSWDVLHPAFVRHFGATSLWLLWAQSICSCEFCAKHFRSFQSIIQLMLSLPMTTLLRS